MKETLNAKSLNQANQESTYFTSANMKPGSYDSRETEKNIELVCNRKPLTGQFHRVAAQTDRKRTPYQNAVLQAYGITPVERWFSSPQNVSMEWSTIPSNVKVIITSFLG